MCSIEKDGKYGHLTIKNIYNHVISEVETAQLFHGVDLQVSSTSSYSFKNNHEKKQKLNN